jgi:outer membrane protein OmpA-like peptidoglycan-associated protein/opacity protein-like surface antigen
MNNKFIAPILVTASTIGFCASALGQEPFDGWDAKFQKRLYLGLGGGTSKLEPDTSGIEDIDVIDDSDSAAHVTIGMDFSRRLSFELQYAELGTATLTGGAEVDYTEVSLSGLLYLWNATAGGAYSDYDGLDTRTGLSLYGRLGGGQMDNEARGVDASRVNDFQVTAGLGAEYALRSGLAVRAEYISYDKDAQYGGLSLLYRFGRARDAGFGGAGELPSLPPPQPISTLPPPPAPAELPVASDLPPPPPPPAPIADEDSDADGVLNVDDRCPDTPAGTPVGETGCAMFNGAMDGVNFLSGSDTLTAIARETLDGVVTRMNEFPDVRVSVHAHTDSAGDDASNMELSRRRALSVVRYLTSKGVSLGRFEARAYGERKPIADNSTVEGRQLNRRVEFVTL